MLLTQAVVAYQGDLYMSKNLDVFRNFPLWGIEFVNLGINEYSHKGNKRWVLLRFPNKFPGQVEYIYKYSGKH